MFLTSGSSVITTMVTDKRTGTKEMLHINGLTKTVYVVNVFMRQVILMTLSSLGIAILISYSNLIFAYKSFDVFFMLMISNLANISFSMWFSTLFDNA